jgi:hypothetical protein
MQVELSGSDTTVILSDRPWQRGIRSMVVVDKEIPFLLPALSAHHFFTGTWPPPPEAIDYEPHESPGSLTQDSPTSATWHQATTPYTKVETRIVYQIMEAGTVEMQVETRSHAAAYPHGYVGLFWGTIAPPGGQRGIHILQGEAGEALHWYYFQGGGDNLACRANTLLGPHTPSAAYTPGHPLTYFFAESPKRFALPIQVARWRDLYYCVEIDNNDIAFTDVLLGTAIGGPSWDIYWRLQPGETKEYHIRLTVGEWPGWEEVEERYRAWSGCIEPAFISVPTSVKARQPFAPPVSIVKTPDSGLALSKELFELHGRKLLEEFNLLGRASVGCFGGTSQNAYLDDALSRDHVWGPYLTLLLTEKDWQEHHVALEEAFQQMPNEVNGQRWIGYHGPEPRKTGVWEMQAFLRLLTGFEAKPETDREWLEYISRVNFLGRRWTERLFDAGQGELFHDPNKQFTQVWRHWTAYVPPDIHKALLARALFRVWNAGPEYNLRRTLARGDKLAFSLALNQFVNETLELAFCWNEQFVPQFKWRIQHFRRLPICPFIIRDGVEQLWNPSDTTHCLEVADAIVRSIKLLMKDLYHLKPTLDKPLSLYAHAIHWEIEDVEIKRNTPLDW